MSDWWRKSVVYQVYPQSFKDTTGNGIGDLNGIKEKLPYLADLGIDVIWLNPIYQSPLVDNGYDISDYYQINPIYGTMSEFDELLQAAHDLGIKIIMDLVVNHTSDQYEWFEKSKQSKDNEFSDYYIWKDPKPDGTPPTDWGSTFGGSAWEFVEARNQYYLHLFAKEQPDLNWENPILREKIYQMMTFWFEKGVDGFRMDVISLISKRQDWPQALPGAIYSKSYYVGASNGPRVHEFLQEMNTKVLSKYDVLTVGETANTTSNQAILYTDPTRRELNMIFHFDHMHLDYGKYGKFSDIRYKMSDLRDVMSEWQDKLEGKGWNSLYWSNHDQPRAVTRFGDDGKYRVESAKMLATLLHMMKGTPYIFQGEEIGMRNVPFESLMQYQDIETKAMIAEMRDAGETEETIKKIVYLKSRDNARTPIAWNSDDKFGFTEGIPWIDYSPDNTEINIEAALNDKYSVFYHYQKLIQLRKTYDIIAEGFYELINPNDSEIYGYTRTLNHEKLIVICSFSEDKVNYVLADELVDGQLLLSNYPDSAEKLIKKLELRPYEALIYLKK
ncbi:MULTISPECIES: alpha-glucosidase [unclassified Enterococcus]|uniref:alpha-glucosidase n=1 Tax=unclassified Enterococcus TaxID=2608891 RepID=UPI0015528749|nr:MULTISPECIES: alpha-glucosidase [unclassified Enterococcus]MBS7576736.1 alpha-glucosidase [Enterococcus sp. MMGLQ5-2]MBS7583777.1 alpha-glucosidase [Enterococcus sp. MMGLQ5-1]NPD11638.1 alpha-glucosidase [Enterococcus sp. MMGLQ5-1]NPD36573.1 alpha-glucosidase [Enterococcus sp. MMGLQ5-2]